MSNQAITNEECGDVAITAAEGGTGYWAQMEEYRWTRWTDEITMKPKEVSDDFVYYTIHTLNEYETEFDGESFDITPAVIRRGFNLYREAGRPLESDGPSYLDADAADEIVQYGVFGKLVYG